MFTPPGKFNELELCFVIEFRTLSFRSEAASEADICSDVFLDSKGEEQPDDLVNEAESDRYAKDGEGGRKGWREGGRER